ncbi:hypothetical protein CcaCcLH18_02937 [Colletotrichum camelliae]|nr:hypothetical protein CcaCcLH18_02937 [Colletotrichum camelliae]
MDYRFNLLKLPLELRQMIYRAYLHADSGYICDAEALFTGKLRGETKCRLTQANNEPIDMALVFTCKTVATEMLRGGLALQVNTVTFSTFYSHEFRLRARKFVMARENDLDGDRIEMMKYIGSCLQGPVYDALKDAYPVFMPVVDHLKDGNPDPSEILPPYASYGQAPSLYCEFVKFALQLAIRHYCEKFDEAMKQEFLDTFREGSPYIPAYHSLAFSKIEPWMIPTDDDFTEMTGYHGWPLELESSVNSWYLRTGDLSKYRWSAAVSAIHFLESLPPRHRAHLRNVILDEDREAVSDPAGHGRGLIPFCQQNPLLRIERRCNLWGNVLRADEQCDEPDERINPELTPTLLLKSDQISINVARWIMEALALEHHGMPAGSFSLLLDGDPAPGLCEDMFQKIVQWDVAWQLARDEAHRRGHLPPKTWIERNGENPWRNKMMQDTAEADLGYIYEGFPQAMRDIAEGKSIVRCNFDVGVPWDVERIVEERRGCSEQEWNEDWFEHKPLFWQTVPPLPLWADCLREDVLPPDGNTSAGRGGFDEWLARWDESSDSEDE